MSRTRPTPTRDAGRRVASPGWRPFALIAAVGIVVFWNSLQGPFIWDDRTAVETNASIRHLWPPTGPLGPPDETPVAGRPLANLTFALNYAWGGDQVAGYHLVNVAVHLSCALLLFAVVRRTLRARRLAGVFGSSADPVALASALVWMVHPLQTEVVNYVTQRTESLMALALLATLYCAIHARNDAHRQRWAAASGICCLLGTGAKESIAIAPLVVVLYDRVFEYDSLGAALRERWRLYAALALSWLALAALMAARSRSTAGFGGDIGAVAYLLNQGPIVLHYLRLSVWPAGLVLDYGLPRVIALSSAWPALLVVGAALALTLVALARWPAAGFAGAVAWLALAPTSSLVPIASEVGAERRMYVPMMALVALAVAGAARAWTRWAPRGVPSSRARLVAGTVAGALVLAAASGSWARNREFSDPVVLWRTVVERRPHGRARLSYGDALTRAGRSAEALEQFRLAVEDYPRARYALGTSLFFAGRTDESIAQLRQFIEANPPAPDLLIARRLLGRVLASAGRPDEAAAEFRAILSQSPFDLDARMSLADTLLAQGRYADASAAFASLATDAPSAQIDLKWGMSLAGQDRLEEATPHFEQALARDSTLAPAHLYLAKGHLSAGRLADSEKHARAAVGLAPGDAEAHNLMGAVLATKGDLAGAAAEFRETLRISPGDPQASRNLAQIERLTSGGRSLAPVRR